MGGAARSAAAAAIGKRERTQRGTVVFMRDRRAVFFMCVRRAVDGAIGRHGNLQMRIN
jgi:hypothetical protein